MELSIKPCRFCRALNSLHGTENVAALDASKVLHVGGHKLTIPQLEELAKEIQLLEQTQLWKILTETVSSQAITLGIKEAKDFDQLMFAKAMLHVVGTQKSLLEILKKEYNTLQEAKALASRVAQS